MFKNLFKKKEPEPVHLDDGLGKPLCGGEKGIIIYFRREKELTCPDCKRILEISKYKIQRLNEFEKEEVNIAKVLEENSLENRVMPFQTLISHKERQRTIKNERKILEPVNNREAYLMSLIMEEGE